MKAHFFIFFKVDFSFKFLCLPDIQTDYETISKYKFFILSWLILCSCCRLEQELEELETGVSATSTKENLSEAAQQDETKTIDNVVSLKAS